LQGQWKTVEFSTVHDRPTCGACQGHRHAVPGSARAQSLFPQLEGDDGGLLAPWHTSHQHERDNLCNEVTDWRQVGTALDLLPLPEPHPQQGHAAPCAGLRFRTQRSRIARTEYHTSCFDCRKAEATLNVGKWPRAPM